VQTSTYSELAGVPVALIGLIGYIAIMASVLVPENEMTRFATVAFTVVGFGLSAYLTYRELSRSMPSASGALSSAIVVTPFMCPAIWRFCAVTSPRRGQPRPRARARPSWRRSAPFAPSPTGRRLRRGAVRRSDLAGSCQCRDGRDLQRLSRKHGSHQLAQRPSRFRLACVARLTK
jgi:hypothetical protein